MSWHWWVSSDPWVMQHVNLLRLLLLEALSTGAAVGCRCSACSKGHL